MTAETANTTIRRVFDGQRALYGDVIPATNQGHLWAEERESGLYVIDDATAILLDPDCEEDGLEQIALDWLKATA